MCEELVADVPIATQQLTQALCAQTYRLYVSCTTQYDSTAYLTCCQLCVEDL